LKQKQRKNVIRIVVLLLFAATGVWYVSGGDFFRKEAPVNKELSNVITKEAAAEEAEDSKDPSVQEKPQEQKEIVVYLCGEVVTPDVYIMPAGSRLYEVVEKAGGFTPEADAAYHNLARQLADGERVYILSFVETGLLTAEQAVLGEEGNNSTSKENGPINLNTATIEQLMELPGIGESKAVSILEYREKAGKFVTVEELMNISGIGEAMFEKIKDKVVIK